MPRPLPEYGLTERDWRIVEDEINKAFWHTIYEKLRAVMAEKKVSETKIENSKLSTVVKALLDGDIFYQDGRFEGKFTSATGRALRDIGATYDQRTKSYSMPNKTLPMDVAIAVGTMDSTYKDLHSRVMDVLQPDVIIDELAQFDYDENYDRVIEQLQRKFNRATKSISVGVNISPGMREKIAKDYSQNLQLYIKNWANENILKLREDVEANVRAGARPTKLAKIIQKNYGSSKSKAKFLARQESSLLLSKYRETRYQQAGITRYRWVTSNDERVREVHRELDGKVFSWGEAVIDRNGTRGNPGEAFGCRCKAEPIFDEE